MIECLSRERLLAFLSDSLEPEDLAATLAHLKDCLVCEEAVDRVADDSTFRREYLDQLGNLRSTPPIDHAHLLTMSTVHVEDQNDTVDVARTDLPFFNRGRYELRKRIAKGGVGEVWEAYDPKLKRDVAIKMVRKDRRIPAPFVDGFLKEGQRLASLRHSGIVRVYDFGEHGGQVYIVTELLSGGTLSTILQNPERNFQQIASVVAKVARAVHAAHLAGLIHRDIKPANIVLDADLEPRLSDFGLAVSSVELQRTSPEFAGTVPYMSPEQSAPDVDRISLRSDIYSLGAVLYELLTGRVPHQAENLLTICWKIQNEPPVPPRVINPAVPEVLQAVCLKCLQKNPDDRYATAEDLAVELEKVLVPTSNSTEEFADASPGLGSGRSLRRTRMTRIGLAIALMVTTAVGLTLILSIPGRDATQRDGKDHTKSGQSNLAIASNPVDVTFPVRVLTNPAGARIVVYPIEDRYGLPDGLRRVEGKARSPVEMDLSPGLYLVVAAVNDDVFHEVFRTVPKSPGGLQQSYRHRSVRQVGSVLEWPEITIPNTRNEADDMGYFDGSADFAMGLDGNRQIPLHHRRLPPFWLESHEVTFADYRRTFVDVLPASLANLKDHIPPDDFPLAGVWWDDAVKYAEEVGRRLPSEAEYEFAATVGGAHRFPWGDRAHDDLLRVIGPVRQPAFDQVNAGIPIFGLFSNVPEWTASPVAPYPEHPALQSGRRPIEPGHYIVRGGSPFSGKGPNIEQLGWGARMRIAEHEKTLGHDIGFRCARSVRPRLNTIDLEFILAK